MLAYTHVGWGTPTASQHNLFQSEKLKVFCVHLTGSEHSTFGSPVQHSNHWANRSLLLVSLISGIFCQCGCVILGCVIFRHAFPAMECWMPKRYSYVIRSSCCCCSIFRSRRWWDNMTHYSLQETLYGSWGLFIGTFYYNFIIWLLLLLLPHFRMHVLQLLNYYIFCCYNL